jgi:hypothetical protein
MKQRTELDRYEVHDRYHSLLLKKVSNVVFMRIAAQIWELFNNLEKLAREQVEETNEQHL